MHTFTLGTFLYGVDAEGGVWKIEYAPPGERQFSELQEQLGLRHVELLVE